MKLTAFVAVTAALAFSPAPVAAAPLLFTITGDFNAVFQMDSSPTPNFTIDGYVFVIDAVPGFPDSANGYADLGFYNQDAGGGLLAIENGGSNYLLEGGGAQLYEGLESAPTFLIGSYDLAGSLLPGKFTLTISSLPGPVPEPGSWVLLASGFALAGLALRRRAEPALQTV